MYRPLPAIATLLTLALASTHMAAVELCHVANAGFLIKGKNAAVLIDGLMQEDQYDGRFALPSEEMLEAMMNRSDPFDNLALVVSTHRHGDHFDPKATIRHMRATSTVRYMVPADTVPTLEANGMSEEERNRTIVIEDGPMTNHTISGIMVQTFDVDHGPNMPQNVGYRVTVDDVSFFHTGDISASRQQLATAGVNAVKVDALIMPFWYGFQNAAQQTAIEESWDYGRIVLTHFNPKPQGWMAQFGGLDGIKNSLATVYERPLISTTEGECTAFQ